MIAISRSQLAIARRKLDVANAERNIKSPTVNHVRLVTLDIQTVGHANVILTARKATTVNRPTVNVHANRTLPATIVNDALMDFLGPNVNRANVILLVLSTMFAI